MFFLVTLSIFSNNVCVAPRTMSRQKITHGPDGKINPLLEHFECLENILLDVVILLNEDGTILRISSSVEKELGYPTARYVGKSSEDFIHKDDRRKARKALEFARDNPNIPITSEVRLERSDGSWSLYENRVLNLLHDPAVRGILVLSRDISERVEVVDSLQQSLATLETTNALMSLSMETDSTTQLLDRVLEHILSLDRLSLDPTGGIFLMDHATRHLTLASCRGPNQAEVLTCKLIKHEDCIFVRAARTGQALIVTGPEPSSAECPDVCRPNRYAIPIESNSQVHGVLALWSSKDTAPTKNIGKELKLMAGVLAKILKKLRMDEENVRLASIPRENPDPFIECGPDGSISYENPAAKALMWQHGLEVDDLLPSNHKDIVETCMKGSCSTRQSRGKVGDRLYHWTYHPIPALKRLHISGRDITDLDRAQKQLVYDAMHDGLTDLPNRNLLLDRINTALGMARRRSDYGFAVLLLDLDRFKVISENLGHSAGDKILAEVAGRLVQCIGTEDTVSRIGGDEFVVLLEDVSDLASAVRTAHVIQERLSAPMQVGGSKVTITTGMGLVLNKPTYESAEEILGDAQTAMYRSKGIASGECVFFDETMYRDTLKRQQAQSELQGALDRDELTVYYQPVLSLKDLRLRGFEALVRWNHPTRGLVCPDEFIPLAEETGLIVPLDDHVLKLACKQLGKWRDSKMPLAWISVNLSAHQFQIDDLVSRILNTIGTTGVNPRRLQLEITEGTAVEDPERAVKMLGDLQEHGIRVAVDDSGTGYSSMAYLKRLPIDALKIDRSFIKGLPESQDDATIAKTVIAMSQAMGLKVVAEGVENERQAMFLRSMGCDEVQGYLYGRPMTSSDATELLKTGYKSKKK